MTQIAEHTSSLEMATPSEPAAVPRARGPRPAEGVHPPRRWQAPGLAPQAPARRRAEGRELHDGARRVASRSSARTARASRRWSGCSRPCCCTTAAARAIFGHDVFKDTRAVRRLVNRVSVEASFFKKMSAAENLGYAARFYGMTRRATRRTRSRRSSTRVGFPEDRRNEPMENLSRGMQQKVALARALLTSPVMLLLLDEPTTGLDPRSKLEVQEFIREIRETHDATILLCTHDLDEAEVLADRVGILDRGELLVLEPAERAEGALRRRDARGGVLRGDRPVVRGRGRRRGRQRAGGVRLMQGAAATIRHELIGLAGVVERNVYLIKRYIWWDVAFFIWTVANTLTIVFIAKGIAQPHARRGEPADHRAADRRSRLGVPRDHLRDRHRDGRLGALGGDDRVHVHGAAVASRPPLRDGTLLGRLRRHPRRAPLRRGRAFLQPRPARRELRRGARRPDRSRRSRSSGSG